MEIYVDLRCLQDARFARRGVGYHCNVLLSCSQNYLPKGCKLVGLVDPNLPPLETDLAQLVDETKTTFADARVSNVSAFIELSPMTHDPTKVARLVGQPSIFSSTIIYDFIPLDVPHRYLSDPSSAEQYAIQLGWLPSYQHYFSISEYSANRLRDLFAIPDSSINVTGVALRPTFEEAMKSNYSKVAKLSFNIPKKYVLCVAGGDKRKNVEILLRAHAEISTTMKDLHLLVVGCYSEHQIEEMLTEYQFHGGKRKNLRVLQGIDDTLLCSLYHHARVSVCCSQIEGFSLPVIEAIACGCPILVSDNAAHRELVGNSVAVFDPSHSDSLKVLLNQILVGADSRTVLLNEQCNIALRFSAEKVAERFWTPICRGIRERRCSPSLSSALPRFQPNRPRLAILSPFPPDASGVADYTRRTVQALGKIADVDVFTNAEIPTPTEEVQNFFPISELPYTSGFYDNIVAIVGNSHFHTQIIELHNRFGGPCLIHDNRLAELYNWIRGPEGFQELASRSLGRIVSFEESQSWIRNPGTLPSPFFDELVPHAQPLIVHSRGIQAKILDQYKVEAKYLPFCVYRDFSKELLTSEAKQIARRRLGIADDVLAVITLGIVNHTKGPQQCIQAIGLARQAGINAELYFVGSASGMESQIHEWAANAKVHDKVHLCGEWVDSVKYTDFVVAADLAIQLRNHFFGGLSGAMLDCIASGLITIANDDLAEALDSPSSVLRISDELSEKELSNQIIHAHTSLDLDHRLTVEREAYLQSHSFDHYAVKMLEVLGLSNSMTSRISLPNKDRLDAPKQWSSDSATVSG